MPDIAEVFAKFRADQPRDAQGRWTTGPGDIGEDAAHVLERATLRPREGDDIRQPVRRLYRAASAALHERAADLAGKVGHAVRSTRIAAVDPVYGGGVQVEATHGLPPGQGHLRSFVQVNPQDFRDDNSRNVLAALHGGLIASGRPKVRMRAPPFGVNFRNGPQP